MVTDAVLEGMAEEVKELEDALKATIQTVRAESKITREDPESNHGRENAQLDCNSFQHARFIFGKLCLSVVLDALEGRGNKLVKIAFASNVFLVFR